MQMIISRPKSPLKTQRDIKIERDEVRDRILQAWQVLRRLPDKDSKRLRMASVAWPQVLRDATEHGAYEGVRLRRPPPLAIEIDRMDEVLDWLLELGKQQPDFCKAVWVCCAYNMTPKKAQTLIGRHRETIRKWRDNGLDRIREIRDWRSIARR